MPNSEASTLVFRTERGSAPSTETFHTSELISANKPQSSTDSIIKAFLVLYRLNVYIRPSFFKTFTLTHAFNAVECTFFKYSEASIHMVNSFSEICVSSQIAILLLIQILINFCGLCPVIFIFT